jgi:hypothetical protein
MLRRMLLARVVRIASKSSKDFHHEVSQRPAAGRTAMDENCPGRLGLRPSSEAIYVISTKKLFECSARHENGCAPT